MSINSLWQQAISAIPQSSHQKNKRDQYQDWVNEQIRAEPLPEKPLQRPVDYYDDYSAPSSPKPNRVAVPTPSAKAVGARAVGWALGAMGIGSFANDGVLIGLVMAATMSIFDLILYFVRRYAAFNKSK